jgi:hypothetical protein
MGSSRMGDRDEILELLEILRTNEEKARRLLAIELKILAIDNFRGLFEELLTRIDSSRTWTPSSLINWE